MSSFFRVTIPIITLLGFLMWPTFRFSIGMVLPEVQNSFTIGESEAGMLLSMLMISSSIIMALIGWIMGRVGIQRTYILGLGVLSVGLFIIASATSFDLLVFSMFVIGIGVGLMIPTVYTIFGEYLPRRRALMLAIPNSIFGLGGLIGPWLTGNLLSTFEWTMPFLMFAVFSSIMTVMSVIFFGSRKTSSVVKNTSQGGYRRVLGSKNVFAIYVSMFLSNMAFVNFITWTPTFLRVSQGFSAVDSGIAFGLFSFAGIMGSISLGIYSDKINKRRIIVFITGVVSSVFSYLVYNMSHDFILLVMILMFFGFSMYSYWNLLITMGQESVGSEHIGAVTGLVQNAGVIGGLIGPTFVGLLIEQIGMNQAMVIGVPIPILLYSLTVLMCKPQRK